MSSSDSLIQPRSLLQTFAQPQTDEMMKVLAMLFQLATWLKGDMRLGTLKAGSVAPSATGTFDIQPPTLDEEWEIMHVQIADSSNIDIADTYSVLYRDDLTALMNVLQDGALRLQTPGIGQNAACWPNRDSANPQFKTALYAPGLTVKRRDSATPWLIVRVLYNATATLGTRTPLIQFIYKRRRLT